MNSTILLIISMAACLGGGILRKHLCNSYENGDRSRYLYNTVVSLVSAIILLILSDIISISAFTVLLALAFGIVTFVQQLTNLQALETGPLSYTTVIISLSTLIPALSGVVFWNEHLSLGKIIGMALMVVCFILSVDSKSETNRTNKKWLICCGIAFLCTGLIGVMQKWHQSSPYKEELDVFLVISFAFSFVSSALLWMMKKNKKETNKTQDNKKTVFAFLPIFLMIISGVCVALNNKLNLFLSGTMDSAVFFPIVNGGGIALTLLSSIIIFRERLSRKQWVGILFGVVAILLLCCS